MLGDETTVVGRGGRTPSRGAAAQPLTSTVIKRPRVELEHESASEQGTEDVEGGSEAEFES